MFKPRFYQIDAVDRTRAEVMAGWRRICLQAATGAGKCLGKGTPVLMFDGTIKPVEDVSVGDRLIGPDSKPRTVLSVANGQEMLYKVTPTKGESYVVNESHILSLKMTRRQSGGAKDEIVNISVTDYLAETKFFRHRAKGWRSGVDFVGQPVTIDPYFIGLWLGDGTRTQPSISKPDNEVLAAVRETAHAWGMDVKTRHGRTCPTHHITNGRDGKANSLTLAMRSYGLMPDKFVPHEYKSNTREIRLAVLAGLLDSDGHLSNGGFDFISKDKRLADDVTFLARSLGLAAYQRETTKGCQDGFSGQYWRVSISGDCSLIPTRIKRKQAPPRLQKKNVLVTGLKVDQVGVGDYYGFEIDGDGLFLLGDFTVTHNTLMAAIIIQSALDKGNRCLFLAHTRELIKQCSDKLVDQGIHHGIIMAGRGYTRSNVQVASKDTLLARAFRSKKIRLPKANLVIVDEAHLSLSAGTYKLLKHYWVGGAVIIGLTATPCRPNGMGMGDFYERLVQAVPKRQLIEEGWLVPTRVWSFRTPSMKGVSRSRGDYVVKEVEKRMDKPHLVGDIVDHWLRIGENRQTIVFASGIRHSENIRNKFLDAGIKAEHVDGKMPTREREAVLERFYNGETKVVTSCGVLTTGVDFPCASCIILARPTESLPLFLQMIGRGLRPYDGPLGKKIDCIILDHAGCVVRHNVMPDEDVEWKLEKGKATDGYLKPKASDEAKVITCPKCHSSFRAAPVCPICGAKMKATTSRKELEHRDGVLIEITKRPEKVEAALTFETLSRQWKKCLAVCAHTGRTAAAAATMFIKETGQRPWNIVGLPDVPEAKNMGKKVSEILPRYYRRKV